MQRGERGEPANYEVGGNIQDIVNDQVDVVMEELPHRLRGLIEEVVHAEVSNAMAQQSREIPVGGYSVVDRDGNELPLTAVDVASGEGTVCLAECEEEAGEYPRFYNIDCPSGTYHAELTDGSETCKGEEGALQGWDSRRWMWYW